MVLGMEDPLERLSSKQYNKEDRSERFQLTFLGGSSAFSLEELRFPPLPWASSPDLVQILQPCALGFCPAGADSLASSADPLTFWRRPLGLPSWIL